MNKKNFPIFISVFIVSLFFTIVLYFGQANLDANYKSTRADNYADAYIDDQLSENEVEKLRKIDGIKEVARVNNELTSGKLNDDLLVVYRQDKHINIMREFSWTEEGRFPQNSKEIMLSKSLVEKYKLEIGDEIPISFGKRTLDGKELEPTNSRLEKESFESFDENTYKLVGLYEDTFNKYAGLSYGLIYDISIDPQPSAIRFDDFVYAYKNKIQFEDDISKALGRNIKLKFDERLVSYYRLDQDFWKQVMAKSVMILALILIIFIFVFFVRNIFWVWGIRKIKELSVYKSIGSTDFQIYKLLIKEASFISIVPLLIGHLLGFGIIYGLYNYAQKNLEISKYEYVTFIPLLSAVIFLISFFVIMVSIIKPARKISKINIIDGIRDNIDLSRSNKKKNEDLWRELRLNNVSSIKSQRYISALGILIISMFILTISVSRYFSDYYNYDDGYNIAVHYFTSQKKVPQVLRELEYDVSSDKSYITKSKYVAINNNLTLSDEAKAYNIDSKIKEKFKNESKEYLDGEIIAMDMEDFEKLGGSKGEFILFNQVQADPLEPLSKAKMVKYFKNPKTIEISMADFNKNLEISKELYDTGHFKIKPYPFVVDIFTDYETYYNIIENANDDKYLNYPYVLKMKIKEKDLSNAKEFIENKLRESLAISERFDVLIGDEIKEQEVSSLKYLVNIALAIGIIIFILNVTNGYSSINISLISRKKEIGSLYSTGMEISELKEKYEKEFVIEQGKSFALVILITMAVMSVISILSDNLNLSILVKYYDYKLFLGFSFLVYGINLLIYHFSLKRILDKPTVELIRTI